MSLDGLATSERKIGVSLSCFSLRDLLSKGLITEQQASVFLLHTAAQDSLGLIHRRFEAPPTIASVQTFLANFSTESLRISSITRRPQKRLDSSQTTCDLADIVDGRLFAHLSDDSLRQSIAEQDNGTIFAGYGDLMSLFERLSGRSIWNLLVGSETNEVGKNSSNWFQTTSNSEHNAISQETLSSDSVLPFKNSVFETHLIPVQLAEDRFSTATTRNEGVVFQEISYWRNQRKSLASNLRPPKLDFSLRRKNQRLMAETRDYAASLTNAVGKVLEPEIIIVDKKLKKTHVPRSLPAEGQPSKAGKKPAKQLGKNKKGGKAAVLEEAKAFHAAKAKSKAAAILSVWKQKCKDLDAVADVQSRYVAAKRYRDALNGNDEDLIGPEVDLYLINVLLKLVSTSIKQESNGPPLDISALVWDAFLKLSRTTSGTTKTIIAKLKTVGTSMGFPPLGFEESAEDRPLVFKLDLPAEIKGSKVIKAPTEFQLEHCGPYFDRSLESTVDPRVPFKPDAWQRSVLDAIDEQKSLFVIAPTSSGKTFISFYAMKQVLESSDDGVIVYIAPTKALVNQIAAEVQARFSKSFAAGQSVWAIHTRDRRINQPTGCQILVTVPHILQIMLLSPENAVSTSKAVKDSWCKRVKRIIFDEIHCIGKADDGVVWEQLLLQAQCPIIALSATVGNPEEFSDWLASTQKANGFDLVTIEQHNRFSDLRKFVYKPPKEFKFSGLPQRPRINIPGLDGEPGFSYIHPIASLTDKSHGISDDLTLEARDCLLLWRAMVKAENKHYPVPKALDPSKRLPAVISKWDIIEWESALKVVLRKWMADNSSPFDAVRSELASSISASEPRVSPHTPNSARYFPTSSERHERPRSLPMLGRTACEGCLTCHFVLL